MFVFKFLLSGPSHIGTEMTLIKHDDYQEKVNDYSKVVLSVISYFFKTNISIEIKGFERGIVLII